MLVVTKIYCAMDGYFDIGKHFIYDINSNEELCNYLLDKYKNDEYFDERKNFIENNWCTDISIDHIMSNAKDGIYSCDDTDFGYDDGDCHNFVIFSIKFDQ